MKTDFYTVLGLSRSASEAEIKRSYRKLARKYHPDMNPGDKDAERKFQEISEAYSVLSDPEKRRIYDKCGMEAFESGNPQAYEKAWNQMKQNGGAGGFGNGAHFRSAGDQGFGSFSDFEDLFRQFGGGKSSGNGYTWTDRNGSTYTFSFDGSPGGFGSSGFSSGRKHRFGDDGYRHFGGSGIFDDLFGGAKQPTAEADFHSDLTIGFREAISGCRKRIRLQLPDGRTESVEVSVPAGINQGQSIRLRGKGGVHPDGSAGDLLLKISISPEPGWQRNGNDLSTSAQIPYTTAVFGGEYRLPTISGSVLCHIPAGTQSGSRIRLKGKGVRDCRNPGVCGDEYVTIEIQVPKHLTTEQRRILKQYEAA